MFQAQEEFRNPPLQYRMKPMNHRWPRSHHKEFIEMLKEYGFGGVVTNVRQKDGFTANPQNLEEFRSIVEEMQENGLPYWIYDENGYPSGMGGGEVLKGHPELEATGLYMVRQVAYEPGCVSYRTGNHREEIIWAARYPLDNQKGYESLVRIREMTPVPFDRHQVACSLRGPEVLYVFCTKPAWEGSPCTHNVCSFDRYLNILDERAVRRFIDLCYEPIAGNIPNAYPGAEAVFTDEPSLMTFYMADNEVWPYALLPWSSKMPEAYEAEYGESLLPLLPWLFEGRQESYPVRIRFYNLVGKMIAKAYTGQLREWCQCHGTLISGHYFAEEMMADHVRSYGNFLEVQKAASYPGVDILACYPEGYFYNTAKYVQMAVRKNRTNGMMAEVCPFDHPEIFEKAHYDNMCAVMNLNFLAGVRKVNSYYETDYGEYKDGMFADFLPRDEEKFAQCRRYMDRCQAVRFNAYVGRLAYLLDGLYNDCDVFIYYGIENTQAKTVPRHDCQVGQAIETDSVTLPIIRAIYEAGHDFYYADRDDLAEAARALEQGEARISGCHVRYVIIPGTEVMYEESVEALLKLQRAGVRVLFIGRLPLYGSREESLYALTEEDFALHDLEEVLNILDEKEEDFSAKADKGMLLKAGYQDGEKRLYFLVNNSREEETVRYTYRGRKDGELLIPESGEILSAAASGTIRIPALRSVFLRF